MTSSFRIALTLIILLSGISAYSQEVAGNPTSATDHKVRLEKTRRNTKESRDPEKHGKSLKKRKEAGASGNSKEARVYKRHRHFADRDIKLKSRSRVHRKENLGVGTE
jgi:hypothetical protein